MTEHIGARAIAAQIEAQDAGRPGYSLHDRRTGAIPEQDRSRAVFPVKDPREDLGSHHEHALVDAGGDRAGGHGETVDEAGACRRQVEGSGVDAAEIVRDARSRRRREVVRREGGDNDKVDVLGFHSRVGYRIPPRGGRQVRGVDSGRYYPPLTNARPLPDPLVGRVEAEGEIVVGDDLRRRVDAETGDGDGSPQ